MKMRLVVAECWTTKHYCCNRVRAIALSPLPVERPQNYSFHDIAVRGGGLADHDQGMMMKTPLLLPCKILLLIDIFSFNINSDTKSQAFSCRCLQWQLWSRKTALNQFCEKKWFVLCHLKGTCTFWTGKEQFNNNGRYYGWIYSCWKGEYTIWTSHTVPMYKMRLFCVLDILLFSPTHHIQSGL